MRVDGVPDIGADANGLSDGLRIRDDLHVCEARLRQGLAQGTTGADGRWLIHALTMGIGDEPRRVHPETRPGPAYVEPVARPNLKQPMKPAPGVATDLAERWPSIMRLLGK